MKIDLNFVIKKLDGKDFDEFEPDGFDKEGKPKFKKTSKLTIRKILTDALTANYQDEAKLDAIEKAKRGWLAMKIYNHKESTIELPVEDVKVCKDLVGKRYSALIVASVWSILDPGSVE